MKDWKDRGRKLLFLPLWWIIILAVISTAALVTVFGKGWDSTLIAYVVYVISFYTLVVICLACWKTIPEYYRRIKEKVYAHTYANRYLTDAAFKTHVNLYCSLAINLIYVAVNAISGILYHTIWFGIFAIYYAIMAIMRFLLVRYVGRTHIGTSRLGELKCSRLCAHILLTVNLSLSCAVLMMIYYDRGFHYQGYLIYVIAMYTFYITTAAIIDMVKYRKYKSPIMSISKIIKFSAALFSMLFLETAMFSQFGEDTSFETKRLMITATGAAISVIILAMAGYMIITSTKEIRAYRKNGKE